MLNLCILAIMSGAAGFGLAWTMRAALARLDLRDKQDVIDVLVVKLEDQSREMVELLQDYHDSMGRNPWTNHENYYRNCAKIRQDVVELTPAGEKS